MRRAVAIHNKQQHQRAGAQKVPGPSKEVSMKNFQTVQAEAAKEATVARATIAQQQDELSALQSKFELLQLLKDELQKSAQIAVLGLQDRASEAQRLCAVNVLALDNHDIVHYQGRAAIPSHRPQCCKTAGS